MADIKSLGDERDKRRPICPHCGHEFADVHPEYSCPRISIVRHCTDQDGGGETIIEYMSPAEWDIYFKANYTE